MPAINWRWEVSYLFDRFQGHDETSYGNKFKTGFYMRLLRTGKVQQEFVRARLWVEEGLLSRSRVMFRGIRMLLSQQVTATTQINTKRASSKRSITILHITSIATLM